MPKYLQLGSVPPKRHTLHAQVPGHRNEGMYYEEVITTQGFNRAYSIVYHLRPPTRVLRIEPGVKTPIIQADDACLRHVHLKTSGIARFGDTITGRVPLMFNSDVVLSRCRPASEQLDLYRNARADEVLFVQQGSGRLVSMFGVLPFRAMI